MNSLYLVQNMPNAKLILYPDANHGSWYQNYEDFVLETNRFSQAKRVCGAFVLLVKRQTPAGGLACSPSARGVSAATSEVLIKRLRDVHPTR